jgi:thiol-disulfide isomerase/thioredoxin
LLYFWEADCGHCKKSTPKLYEVFEKYKDQGVEVLAVHVINSIEGKEKWIDFINEYELLDWTNCWSPHNNDFRTDYNLLSFPQLFLLDEDKKIIAKGLAPEQVGEILDRLLKKE